MFHPQVRYLTLTMIVLLTWPATPLPVNPKSSAQIVSYGNVNDGLGGYSFRFETSDGTKRNEDGNIYADPVKGRVYGVQGSYGYIGPDGIEYTVQYTADENGFHPIASHLPATIPPVPPNGFASFSLSSGVVASLLG